MAIGTSGSGRQTLTEINVTPLVDVMLVLLIIFMVTAPLIQQGVEVALPQVKAQPVKAEDQKLVLSIKSDRSLWLGTDDKPARLTLPELEEKLKANARVAKDRELYLMADRALPYGFVVEVMAAVQRAGVTNLGMITDPVPDRPEGRSGSDGRERAPARPRPALAARPRLGRAPRGVRRRGLLRPAAGHRRTWSRSPSWRSWCGSGRSAPSSGSRGATSRLPRPRPRAPDAVPVPVPGPPAPAQKTVALPAPKVAPKPAPPRPASATAGGKGSDALSRALDKVRKDDKLASKERWGDPSGLPEGDATDASEGDRYLGLVTQALQSSYRLPATISEQERLHLARHRGASPSSPTGASPASASRSAAATPPSTRRWSAPCASPACPRPRPSSASATARSDSA